MLLTREKFHLATEIIRESPAKRIKILSLGDSSSGKSCLIKRYCESRFIPEYISTIGIDYGVKTIDFNNNIVKINFWDVAGDPIYYDTRSEFYKDTTIALLIFDCNVAKSFEGLDKWIEEIKKCGQVPVIFLVCCKIDLERNVSADAGKAFAMKRGLQYFETSALSGVGVKELFDALIEAAISI